jgi:DNA-binding NarL/FixJ family response regulator
MRLVIVDDHAIVREGLRLLLSDEDDVEVVGEAADGRAALDLLDECPADIVLLDLRMEGMGGLETIRAIAAAHPRARVVVLTMHDDRGLLRRAIQAGARGYVLKGSPRDVVVGALRAVSAGGSYIDPRLTEDLVTLAADPRPGRTSDEDLEVLRLLAAGMPNRDVAERIGTTPARLRTRLRQIYAALGASGRAEAVAIALRRGLIE